MADLTLPADYSAFLTSFKSEKFTQLWPAQSHVLGRYNGFFQTTDLAIELPTGAGKTLIALLIAEAWRQSGKKVAVLSANKTLARQMVNEAGSLRIPAVLMEGRGVDIPGPDKRAYQRAQQVGVMNYWVYFNQRPVIDPADLLIMDDAHLAEHCLHSLFSVEISKFTHGELFRTLVSELAARLPEYAVLTDALGGDSFTPPELLSFFDQNLVLGRLVEIINASPTLEKDADLSFRWQRLRNKLGEANIYLGTNAIWIRPYIYPLVSFNHYADSSQRLYVSATIGDPSDLSRRLGVKPITKIPVAPEHAEKTSGRRLIVMNRIEEEDIPPRLAIAIHSALTVHPKSLWLCASAAEATKYRNAVTEWLNKTGFVGHPTWQLSALGDEIDHFKAAKEGHLFVAGRFDGMDFMADECRLVVVTTLPRAINLQEEFISAYLRDSGFMKRRTNQRIVQALGRCNRAEDDFGVYVLADRRFASHFGLESNKEGISANMIAEIDMAQDNAEIDQVQLAKKVKAFLSKDFKAYDEDLAKYSKGVPPQSQVKMLANAQDIANSEVLGWSALFDSQNFNIAADRFEEVWDAYRDAKVVDMGAFHKWSWARAVFGQGLQGEPKAKQRSLELAEEAIDRGGKSSWFNRLRASVHRVRKDDSKERFEEKDEYSTTLLRAFTDMLEKVGAGGRFDKYVQSISDSLNSDKHAQFCEGLERLGTLLGYSATRPKGNAVTDNRWRGIFGNDKEVVTFEAKIEHSVGKEITPTHIGQAHNQLNRALAEFSPLGYSVRGTVVTHLTDIDAAARSAAGAIRVISREAILALFQRVQTILSVYRDGWSMDNVAASQTAAAKIFPKCPPSGWLIRALQKDDMFITGADLLKEWRE